MQCYSELLNQVVSKSLTRARKEFPLRRHVPATCVALSLSSMVITAGPSTRAQDRQAERRLPARSVEGIDLECGMPVVKVAPADRRMVVYTLPNPIRMPVIVPNCEADQRSKTRRRDANPRAETRSTPLVRRVDKMP